MALTLAEVHMLQIVDSFVQESQRGKRHVTSKFLSAITITIIEDSMRYNTAVACEGLNIWELSS